MTPLGGRARAWLAIRAGAWAAFCVLALAAVSTAPEKPSQTIAEAKAVAVPSMRDPDYLRPAVDPVFGTSITKVTQPGHLMFPAVACGSAYCTHRYSSAQAWNADQSLLLIAAGCSGFCFLDGNTYAPAFHRAGGDECEWHPADPDAMVCVSHTEIYAWAPRADTRSRIYAPPNYRDLQFGPYKGNLSADGNRLVIRATAPGVGLVAFVYDLSARRKYPDIRLSEFEGSNGYCGVSPSGRYVFCSQSLADESTQSYVFSAEGVLVQHWSENHRPGHGDMAVDVDGEDVYLGISKADPDRYHIIKRRLRDGWVTDLARYGHGQHASMRSLRRPGWVFVTYAGSYWDVVAHPAWAPFQGEIVAVRIDGSGEIRRIVHTRTTPSGYWSEAHGSPSPDGSQVIWASNWGHEAGPVAAYVARLQWPVSAPRE